MLPTDFDIFSSADLDHPVVHPDPRERHRRARPRSARSRSRGGGRRGRSRRRGSRSRCRAASRPSPSTRCASRAGPRPRARARRCPRPPCAPSRARSRAGPPSARRCPPPRPGPCPRGRGSRACRSRRSCGPGSRRRRRTRRRGRARSGPRSGRRSRRSSPSPAARRRGGRGRGGRCPRRRRAVISAASSADGTPRLARGVVDLVVDVGDVDHQLRLVALVLEEAAQEHEDDERARVADVDPPVDGRPAGVDPDLAAGSRGSSGRSSPLSVSLIRTSRIAPMLSRTIATPGENLAICGVSSGPVALVVGRPTANVAARMGRHEGSVDHFAARARGRGGSRRRSRRCPTATWARTPGFDATFQIRLGDVGRTWEVRARGASLRGPPLAAPASPTWSSAPTRRPGSRCARGGCRGSTRSPQRRLYARGNLDLALGFEGLFRLPGDRAPAAADHRGRDAAGPDLDPDRRRRARARDLPPRARRRTRPRSSRPSRR